MKCKYKVKLVPGTLKKGKGKTIKLIKSLQISYKLFFNI